MVVEEGRDSKQILMDHLKAAGLDPSILDESNTGDNQDIEKDEVEFGQDEGGLVNSTNESFDNEDDDDEEEEEVGDVPASSSSGIEEGAQS